MTGVVVVMPTPFDTDGSIDEASLERLVNHYMSLGVQGLTIMGVMGEGAKLTEGESNKLMRRIFDLVNGQIPLIVGASNPSDEVVVSLGETAMALGAAGLMISPKSGLQNDDAVFNYFANLTNKLGGQTPICVQDYPPASGVNVSVEGLLKLFSEFETVEMVKLEDNPGLDKLTRLIDAIKALALKPAVFVGNNALFTELELARGAAGIMTGFAFPEMLLELYRLSRANDFESASDLYETYLPLIRYESQPIVGLAARKYVLKRQGLIDSPTLRDPAYPLTSIDRAEIDRMLDRLERRLGKQA